MTYSGYHLRVDEILFLILGFVDWCFGYHSGSSGNYYHIHACLRISSAMTYSEFYGYVNSVVDRHVNPHTDYIRDWISSCEYYFKEGNYI